MSEYAGILSPPHPVEPETERIIRLEEEVAYLQMLNSVLREKLWAIAHRYNEREFQDAMAKVTATQ